MNTRQAGSQQYASDLHTLLDALLEKPSPAPARHGTRQSETELRPLLLALRNKHQSAGGPVPTGCCGVVELQGVYGADPATIITTLKTIKVSHQPGIFFATTNTAQTITIRSLKRAGFTLAIQALNPRYQAYDPGHTTQLWVIDANHIPERPLDIA